MAKKEQTSVPVPVPVDEDALYVVTEVDADDLIASHHICRGLPAARKLALQICEESFGPLAPRKRQIVRIALTDNGQYLENRGNGGCSVNIDVLEPPRDHTLALLTMQELATVLAALRHWQGRPSERVYFKDIATDCGKFPAQNTTAIDKLRRRLNGDPSAGR